MRTFLLKIAMLFSFLMSAAFGWLAVTMFFDLGLLNILMGIIALFFLFRALEFVDIIRTRKNPKTRTNPKRTRKHPGTRKRTPRRKGTPCKNLQQSKKNDGHPSQGGRFHSLPVRNALQVLFRVFIYIPQLKTLPHPVFIEESSPYMKKSPCIYQKPVLRNTLSVEESTVHDIFLIP